MRKKTLVIFSVCALIFSPLLSADEIKKYVNDDYGFSLMIPMEWEPFENGHYTALVEFRRGKAEVPAFGVFVNDLSNDPERKTALDLAKSLADEFRQKPDLKIIEEPHDKMINGIPAVILSMETKDPAYKTVFYNFLVNSDVLTIYAVYEFGSQYDRLLEILDSFQLDDADHSYRKLSMMKMATPNFQPVDQAQYAVLKNAVVEALASAGSFKTRYVMRDLSDESLASIDFKSSKFNMTFVSSQEFEVERSHYANQDSKTWRVVDKRIFEKFNTWMESPDLSFDARIDSRVQKAIDAKKDAYKFLTIKKYVELFNNEIPTGIFDDRENGYFVFDFEPQDANFLLLDQNSMKAEQSRLWIWVGKDDSMIRLVRLVFRGFDGQGKPVKHKHDQYFRAINASFELGAPPL